MSFGHARNTGIPYIREYAEALGKFENTKPIGGKGANAGKIALGHRHRVAEFHMEKSDTGVIKCVCYQTPVVSFHPDGNIEVRSGGWASQTTAMFIADVLPVSCRIRDGSLVIGVGGDEYKLTKEGVMFKRIEGKLTPTNLEPEYVYRVKRAVANNVRKKYTDFIRYFNGVVKLREGGMVKEDEYIQVFGIDEAYNAQVRKPKLPSDIALRNKADVESMFAMIESSDHEMQYKATLLIMKQFGKRHYWKDNGYSITQDGVKRAMNNLIFARHKDEIFDVVELPLGTVKKDSWRHLF
jgi:hypothetical protein